MQRQRWAYFLVSCCLSLLAACQSNITSDTACDPATDPARCISVGMLSCTAPQQDCRNGAVDGCETNIAIDLDNCGKCGTHCQTVSNGQAVCAEGACGIGECAAPYLDCNLLLPDGCEANSSRDPEHCGDCDTRCPAAANAAPACASGKCKFSCNAPFLDCNNNTQDGCEINTATDINNCGSCGNKCPASPNGTAVCANGACIYTKCTAPFLTCGAGPSDSCETNTSNDTNNCAACGNKCPQIPNASPACKSGACGIGACNGTYRDCNNTPTDGCEVDSAADALHCGGCGQRCDLPNAAPACTNSSCTIASCVGAFKDCNNTPTDGCEINSATDPNNCSGCNVKCPAVSNGMPGCTAGLCGVGSCNAPFKDCNGAANDGCEINTAGDVNNCGACNNKCPTPANAVSASCSVGVCKFTCAAGFADCDGDPTNGCEVNLQTDENRCGSCGNVCGLKPNTIRGSCSAGTCRYTCSAGFGDCNANTADGCETNTASDMNNCGACNARCSIANGTGSCSGSVCRVNSCNAPFRDCDMSSASGCESNVNGDPNNCGGCNNRCPARPNTSSTICSGGTCGFNCIGGRANCNGNVVDGCETDIVEDDNNCGRCGNKCGFFDWCNNSRCCTFGFIC